MKLKRLLASILCLAMVLSTMCFSVSAESENVLGEADFETNGGVVFDGTNYYDSLADAVKAVHGIEDAILYCKPGADLGVMTHGHVCKNLTVFGNSAYLSGGEQDFEIDYPAASGINCSGLTEDVTLTVDNLEGAGAWGSRTSEYNVNLIFTNCKNMGKVFYMGTTGEINITMTDCTFTSNDVSNCKVYSNAAGTITLTNVDFSGIEQPVALGNDSTGTQTIILTDCDFENCGASTQDWTVPVSVKSKKTDGSSVLKVENCTFIGTVTNSIGQDADILFDYGVGNTTATIANTTAKVGVETAENVADYAEINSDNIALLTNAGAEVQTPVAEVNGEYFTDLAAAFKSVNEDATIEILSNITIDTAWQCNFGRGFASGTFNNNEVIINGNGHVIKFTGKMTDGNTEGVISTGAPITVNDLTFDLSECPAYRRVISARTSAVIDNCTFIGNPENTSTTYAVIVGESGGDMLANTTLVVSNSDFDDFNYGISDNRNAEDIKALTIDGNEFNNASVQVSASEEVNFNNNEMTDSWVRIRSFSPADTLVVTAIGNTLESNGSVSAEQNYIRDGKIVTDDEAFTLPVATIGANGYFTITDAINAAEEDDVIIIAPGTYDIDPANKLKINKSITITGNPNYGASTFATRANIEKPVIKISDVTNGGVEYHATNVTFDNLVFEVVEDATGSTWNIAAIGYYYENTANREGLTVTNCDFINNSNISLGAIAANIGKYTITNNTFTNFATGVWSYVDHGAADEIVVSDNTFANVADLVNIYHGAAADGTASVTIANNKATDGSATQITVIDFGQQKPTPATAYDNVTITGNDAEVVLGNYAKDSFNDTIENNDAVVYTYASEAVLRALESAGVPEGEVYVNYGASNEVMYKVVDGKVYAAADALEVEFELASEAEGEKVYNINLKANAQGIINRLNSADLTFLFTQVEGNSEYEIIASNSEVAINPVDNSKVRYEFHYNGKDNVLTDTDTVITIGQVKFTGYGKFNFAVDSTATTNAAHSTTMQDNIVDTFVPGGILADGTVVGDFDITDDTINGVVIAIPVRDLTINIDFPNAVADQAIAYQDMKVVISGGDLAEDITIDLGSDAVETALDIFGQADAKFVADFADGSYVINVTDALTVNNAYTVTVSGAGYRTARYTVTMTTDKTLRFWNNVMDEAQVVEVGKDSSIAKVTFLAGDIVKDNNINIYDLSAVVSYFGSVSTTENGYAKYDLNRDGVIDSKDVAYVLVSWNN